MDILEIESEALRVRVAPGYGARVVGLLDRTTGREWMAPGGFSASTGEAAAYLAAEAAGWDECFPTVSPWDASATPWGRKLRDHGDLWGRPWDVVAATNAELTTLYTCPLYAFERSLRLEGARLISAYRVVNHGDASLPFLWALHALLHVTPQDRIALDGVETVMATYLSLGGSLAGVPTMCWPGPNDAWPADLDVVQPVSRHLAAKLYAAHVPSRSVAVGHGTEWLEITWDAAIDSLGIWLNYGGWPAPGDVHHIALEPTTAPADHLGQVLDGPAPATIAAGAMRSWEVTFTAMNVLPRRQEGG